MLGRVWKSSGCFFVVLMMFILQACGSSSNVASTAADPQPAINPAVLDTAASFLAAATGKENPIGIDQVVFVNTVFGINEPLLTAVMEASDKAAGSMGLLFGDLWITLRDENGIPIPDANGCNQPIASMPIELPVLDENGDPVFDDEGNPLTYFSDTVPMILSEYMDGEFKCEVDPLYVDYTIPVEMGRLNMVRAFVQNPDTMARAFEESMKNINASVEIKTDLSGRLILVSEQDVLDEDGNVIDTELVEATIDAPRENLALYRALMVEGRLAGYGVERIGEEGERIPAPWLEIRPDLELGDLAFLREGTPGRDGGVGLIDGYADLTVVQHSTEADYSGQFTDYVQYHPAVDPEPLDYCPYTDENDEAWSRVFAGDGYEGDNIRGFARHADDARKMIVFMHNIIQDVPPVDEEPNWAANLRADNHAEMGVNNYARHLMFETAAAALGAASGKEVPLSVDSTVFVNTVLGINELGNVSPQDLYGDLWVLKRDANGVPLHDELGCVMPIASEPIILIITDENGDEQEVVMDTVPMVLEEYMDGLFKCAPMVGFEDYVMEVEMGRLNAVRSYLNNPGMMDRHLYEVVNRINAAVAVKRDLAGRIILTTMQTVYDEDGNAVYDEDGNVVQKPVDAAIDSPLENLAVYRALLKFGTLEVQVTINIEGTKTPVDLKIDLPDEALAEHGMEYLKYGANAPGPPSGIGHLANGYADFSEVAHCPRADYEGVLTNYVERQDVGCPYVDRLDEDIWMRVLDAEIGADGEDENPASNIAAFVQHADNARRVIVFIHSVIQDPVAVQL